MSVRAPGFLVAAAAAALIVGAFAGPVSSAPLPPPPEVTIHIDSVPPVDVRTTEDVVVQTNGTVNVTLFSFVETKVFLNVSVTITDWPASIEPSQVNLTGSGSIPVNITVYVPPGAAADSDAAIVVEANVSVPPVGRIFTNQTALPIIPYYDLALTPSTSSSPQTFEAPLGAETSFAFRLQNLGNGRDSFEVSVKNLADLQARGINIELPPQVSNVGAKVTVSITGKATLPDALPLDNYTLEVEALSSGAALVGQTIVKSTTKTMRAVAAPPTNGNGPGNDTNTTPPKGFLPGFDAAAWVAATGMAALAAVAWRRFRPPSRA